VSATTPTELPTPVDPDLEAGDKVGEYEVTGKLGQGAFGTVFRAVHPVIGKEVAIKVLARRFSVDPEMVSRFIAEARAVNQIRHRHIIDIFSFGQLEDGRHYYVMEYLDGEPLDARIDREGRLPLAEALPILHAIGRALDAAHAKGIAHRDLKAENVFLGRDPDGAVFPKLLDFGIAKLLAPDDEAGAKHRTRTGTPVGTPYYMSPEQCRGRDVDHRTDVYAFGVLAYRMITGSYPLDADDHMSVLIRQMQDVPAPASELVPELPAGIDDAFAWLMAKEPAQRPPSLRAALAAIGAAAVEAGIPVTAAWDVGSGPHGQVGTAPSPVAQVRGSGLAPTVAGRGERPARRRWVKAALVAMMAVAAGVAALVITIELRREPAGAGEGEGRPAIAVAPVAAPSSPAVAPVASPTTPDLQAPQAPAIAAADHVIVTITGVPDDTEVTIGTAPVGVAPGPVQLPRAARAVVLTFKAAGHIPASRTITPDRDRSLAVALKRRLAAPAASAAPKRPSKDDIIDVFSQGAP
jgi:serine/threonine-protein kinase